MQKFTNFFKMIILLVIILFSFCLFFRVNFYFDQFHLLLKILYSYFHYISVFSIFASHSFFSMYLYSLGYSLIFRAQNRQENHLMSNSSIVFFYFFILFLITSLSFCSLYFYQFAFIGLANSCQRFLYF